MSPSRVILINGPVNSGKTSVARELVRSIGRCAHIEVDALRAFVNWMPLEESIPLNLRNAAAVALHFLEAGIDVVLTYPLTDSDHDFLQEQLERFPIHSFTLAPRREIALSDRGGRTPLTNWERERIAIHYDSGVTSPRWGIIIDNSDLTAEQTAREIMEQLKY